MNYRISMILPKLWSLPWWWVCSPTADCALADWVACCTVLVSRNCPNSPAALDWSSCGFPCTYSLSTWGATLCLCCSGRISWWATGCTVVSVCQSSYKIPATYDNDLDEPLYLPLEWSPHVDEAWQSHLWRPELRYTNQSIFTNSDQHKLLVNMSSMLSVLVKESLNCWFCCLHFVCFETYRTLQQLLSWQL